MMRKKRERWWRKRVQLYRRREREARTHAEAQRWRARRRRAEARLAKLRRQPRVYTREQWGARPPRRTPPPLGRVTHDTLHHSAAVAPKGMTDAAFARRLRTYQVHHMLSLGWIDLGYNWAINPATGSIFEGRRGVGAHTLNDNTGNNGILVDGDYTRQALPDLGLVGLSIERCRRGPVIYGHRERPGQSTACPGALIVYAQEHRRR